MKLSYLKKKQICSVCVLIAFEQKTFWYMLIYKLEGWNICRSRVSRGFKGLGLEAVANKSQVMWAQVSFFFLTGWVEDVAAKGCWRWLWWSWFRRFRGCTFFILLVAFICVGPQTWHRTSCIQTARKQPALSSWASQPKVNSMQSNGLSTWRDSFRVMWSHKAFKRLLRGQQKSKRTWRIFLRR